MNPDDTRKQDGGAIFDALAAIEGMPERGQPTGEQEREELSDEEPQPAALEAELGRADAEKLKADPLFDASPNDSLLPSTEKV